jgi:uncharacterized membrane protein YfcA
MTVAIVAVAFFAGGAVKGVIGMGLPTVAIAILSAVLGVREAVPLLVVPAFLTNVWQGLYGGQLGYLMKRLWLLYALSCAGVGLGSFVFIVVDPGLLNAVLGAMLGLYALIGLSQIRFHAPASKEPYLTPLVGLINGVVSGATGSMAIPSVPYMQALGLDKDALVQAMGILFATSTLALGIALAGHRAFALDAFMLSSAALVPTMIGMYLGQFWRARISSETFRRWLLVCLLVLGVQLVWKGLT